MTRKQPPMLTLVSYIVPTAGCLIMKIWLKEAHRTHSGQWFAGFREALIGLFVVSVCTLLAAIGAFRRREAGAIAAIVPFIASVLGSLYFGGLLLIGAYSLLHNH